MGDFSFGNGLPEIDLSCLEENDDAFDLASSSYYSLIKRLEGYGNTVTQENKESLRGLMNLYASALVGILEISYYLCPLEPGAGKTESISCFIEEWKARGFLSGGSILIAVNTKDQIKSLVKRLGMDDSDFACFTRDEEFDSLGVGIENRSNARILLTTQQMVAARSFNGDFNRIPDFFYKGSRRPLIIWDESYIQSEQVSLAVNKIYKLVDDLNEYHRGFADTLAEFAAGLTVNTVGQRVVVGDDIRQFIVMLNTDAKDGDRNAARIKAEHSQTLDALTKGHKGELRLGQYGGVSSLTLVGCGKPMPADFAPVIILDASGRVRATYDLMEAAGVEVVRLPAKPNDYANMKIRFWQTACGKDALRDDAKNRVIIGAVAKVIQERPDEDWLVIGPKASARDGIAVEGWLRETLPPAINDRGNVRYLHWGRHTATNDYKNVRNVIVIGTFDYGNAGYDALAAAARGACTDSLDRKGSYSLFRAEYSHNLLQAVMRGNARNAKEGKCGECNVYVIASAKVNVELLGILFPGADIQMWRKYEKELKGQAKQLVDYLKSVFFIRGDEVIKKGKVVTDLGFGKSALSKLLAKYEVRSALARLGITWNNNSFVMGNNI